MFARMLALLLATIYLLLASPVYAQTQNTPPATSYLPADATHQALQAGQLPATISPTSPLYTDLLLSNMFHSFSCLAVGQSVIGQPCLSYQMTRNAQGMLQGIPVLSQTNLSGGALGAVTSVIGMLYVNPPVRTADYLASVGQSLGIVKETHAQGVGGSGEGVLHPILTLWQVSRNVSYVIMIIVFLIIGLMIMFRNRINPQTVITAQAALPGLVIGLILITFSYFLAGLVSDTAFLGTNMVGYYFSAAQGITPPNSVENMKKQNVLSIVSPLTGIIDRDNAADALSSVWNSLSETPQRLLSVLAMFITAQPTLQFTEALKIFPSVGEGFQALIVGIAAIAALQNPTAVIGLTLAFIATAILLYAMFKLLLRLINAYLNILFLTITAPFQFLVASLPGRQSIATGWVLSMLCHVLAFPAVFAVLYFVAFLMGPNVEAVKKLPFDISQRNPVTGTSTFPLFGGLEINFVNILLSFGVLVASPSIPDIISRAIGRMSQAGQLIGQEIGGGIGQGRGYAGQFQQGVGTAAGQIARARGLFNTPGYESYNMNDDPNNPVYGVRQVYGKPGFSFSYGALARNRWAGDLISRITGGRVGGVPPMEKTPVAGKKPGGGTNSTPV